MSRLSLALDWGPAGDTVNPSYLPRKAERGQTERCTNLNVGSGAPRSGVHERPWCQVGEVGASSEHALWRKVFRRLFLGTVMWKN